MLHAVTNWRPGPNPGGLALYTERGYYLDRNARQFLGTLESNALHYLVFLIH